MTDPHSRDVHRLHRLEVLMDSVYAIVIVVIAIAIPTPSSAEWQGDSVLAFLADHSRDLSFALIAMVLVVIYWSQSHTLFGNLERTDGRHSTIALLQIFLLLFYFVSVDIGMDFEDRPDALALQSIMAALVGFAAVGGWWYASHGRRLVAEDIDAAKIAEIKVNILAEPLTALLTLLAAPFGPDFWGLVWLVYPLVAFVLRKWGRLRPEAA